MDNPYEKVHTDQVNPQKQQQVLKENNSSGDR